VNPIKIKNGYIEIPTAPGLGLEIKEEVLREHPCRDFPPRKFRSYHEEGP